MKLFWAYLRLRRGSIFALLLLCAVFSVSFALYHLPLGAVLYPTLLCLLLGALWFCFDFPRFRRKHRHLSELQTLPAAVMPPLPPGVHLLEDDYQAIIQPLQQETAACRTRADAAYQEMLDYYTVWAHQIKTPIAAMHLTLQNEDSPLSRSLSSELFRIAQYVEMVLVFLRLDSPSSDYVFRSHNLDAIVKRSVKQFAGEFILRKIRLEYEPIQKTVVTDEKWLSFVLEQLLSNALKYTPQGAIRIFLQPPATLCIQDTGVGIAPEDLPRIFEKGYTGYNGRADQTASGLGLYLCKRICYNLGADIQVVSQPGQGATFSINLEQYPLKEGHVLTKM